MPHMNFPISDAFSALRRQFVAQLHPAGFFDPQPVELFLREQPAVVAIRERYSEPTV